MLPKADENEEPQSLDATEFQEIIRGLDLERKDESLKKEKKEELVEMVEEKPSLRPTPKEPKVAEPTSDLAKALDTIKRLEGRLQELETRPREITREVERAQPVDYDEVFPGVRLPKDRTKRPFRLTEEDLLKLKWNDDPAGALEAVGNALYLQLVQGLPDFLNRYMQAARNVETAQTKRMSAFYEVFPDLEKHGDLLEIVERGVLTSLGNRVLPDRDYIELLGNTTQERLASLRGQSVDEYRLGLQGSSSNRGGRVSRAETGSSGRSIRQQAGKTLGITEAVEDLGGI